MTELDLAHLYEASKKQHELHQFSLAGQEWTYRTSGSGDRVLVALPGALGGADVYFVMMSELAGNTRVIAVDVPFTSHASEVDDALVEILDREGVRTATFLGASFGGMLIQAFAQTHPERVTGLILSQTGSPGGLGPKSRFWARAVRWIPLFVLRGLLRLLLGKMLGKVTNGAFWSDHYQGVVDSLDQNSLPSRYELTADLAESLEWAHGGAGLWDGPVTILQSRRDSLVNRRTKDALRELYPSADTEFFPTDGHGAYVHDPLGFSRTVGACLT